MKILSILLCLFLSVAASAQSQDSIRKNTSADTVTATTNKPLIVIDGKVFKGDLKTIDPKTIKSVDILKGKDATAIYGAAGKNGVMLITTKK